MSRRIACLAWVTWLGMGLGGVHAAEPPQEFSAVCSLEPGILDVRDRPGPLIGRIEFVGVVPGRRPGLLDVSGVHVGSVAGVRVPGPQEPGEGIDAASTDVRWEDKANPEAGTHTPNGRREFVVRFDQPCDGDPATRGDGDAGDILSMLLDVVDGSEVEVCLAGSVDGASFQCCDRMTVRNRGLRDLPGRRSP